jgi:DNA-binding CsgD family transcriptional regulator
MTIFLATLGQRPEAITMALDVLLSRYAYTEIVILHTDAERSGIAESYAGLMRVMRSEYGSLRVRGQALCDAHGLPLTDIRDQHSAEAYYLALLEIMRHYRVQYLPVHLLVAGGRKAMSIYAALAAALLFGEHDRLWTIHTPPELMQAGLFHIPAGLYDQVQIIQLPVSPSRLLPGTIAAENIAHLLQRTRASPRQQFLAALTPEESKLAEVLHQHAYQGNEELATLLGKSPKTIGNQLRSIYSKLFTYFDLDIEDKRKRQALLDVLAGRV